MKLYIYNLTYVVIVSFWGPSTYTRIKIVNNPLNFGLFLKKITVTSYNLP